MKRFFIILSFCICGLLQADQQGFIMQVKKLATETPNRETFINSIMHVPKGKDSNIFYLSQKVSPRLYAALLQAKTSLVFTDDDLNKKLYELELEQDLLTALEGKNLNGAFEAISKGADVNTATPSGHTSLMLAVLKADQTAVKDLLKRHAHVSAQGEFVFEDHLGTEHMSAIDLAKRLNYQPIANILDKAS